MIAKFFLLDNLNKDMKEATEFRDSLRSEAKDWEKKFSVLQKERAKEVEVTKRQLRERQELYLGIDTYLLRCLIPQLYLFILTSYLLRSGGSRGPLTSTTSTLSLEYGYDKVE